MSHNKPVLASYTYYENYIAYFCIAIGHHSLKYPNFKPFQLKMMRELPLQLLLNYDNQSQSINQHGDLHMPRLIISKYEATSNDTIKNINSDKTFQFKKIEMIYRKLINFSQNN